MSFDIQDFLFGGVWQAMNWKINNNNNNNNNIIQPIETDWKGSTANGNVQLHVREYGSHNKNKNSTSNFVLSHGIEASGLSWDAICQLLVPMGFYCLAYDRRGWGNSARPADTTPPSLYTPAMDALDLALISQAYNVQTPTVVGHSYMGMGALMSASNFATATQTNLIPSKYISISGRIGGINSAAPFGPAAKTAFTSTAPVTNMITVFNQYAFTEQSTNLSTVSLAKLIAAANAIMRLAAVPAIVGNFSGASPLVSGFPATLPAFTAPVLLLTGTNDQVVQMQNSRVASTLIPNCRYQEITGAPHFMLTTHANTIANAMNNFVKGIVEKAQA